MSAENVEIVRRGIEAYNRRDVEAVVETATPDVEWFTVMGAVEGEVFRGPDGVQAYFSNLSDTWEEVRITEEEVRDLGDRVLWLGRTEGRERSSRGIEHSEWRLITATHNLLKLHRHQIALAGA